MEFLKSLWPNSSSTVIAIPQHTEGELEDELDLKVKSLIYLYKRLSIDTLPSFIQDENGVYNLTPVTDTNNDKLDVIYNKIAFERELCANEHRILIDWFKNRFRSICILSDDVPFATEELGKNFRFTVLKPSSDDDTYIQVLVNSDIYIEHYIEKSVKISILRDIIAHQRSLKPSFKKEFNKNDRAKIILSYLCKLSEHVQIERIYKASIFQKIETLKTKQLNYIKEEAESQDQEDGVRLFPSIRSRSPSPIRPQSKTPLSPVKLNSLPELKPQSQSQSQSPRLRSRSQSPSKLRKKQSMTLLKLDKSLETHGNEDTELSIDELTTLQKQAELAVLSRIERERSVIREY